MMTRSLLGGASSACSSSRLAMACKHVIHRELMRVHAHMSIAHAVAVNKHLSNMRQDLRVNGPPSSCGCFCAKCPGEVKTGPYVSGRSQITWYSLMTARVTNVTTAQKTVPLKLMGSLHSLAAHLHSSSGLPARADGSQGRKDIENADKCRAAQPQGMHKSGAEDIHRGRVVAAAAPTTENLQSRTGLLRSRSKCLGCGITMQDQDPLMPGYFKQPVLAPEEPPNAVDENEELEEHEIEEEEEDEDEEEEENASNLKKRGDDVPDWLSSNYDVDGLDMSEQTPSSIDVWNQMWEDIVGDDARGRQGRAASEKKQGQKKGKEKDGKEKEKVVVCARCHSLRNYGEVREKGVENLLPDFDFERVVGTRLKRAWGRRAVVVMVIDVADFDGSFPRKIVRFLAEAEAEILGGVQGNRRDGERTEEAMWRRGVPGNIPRLIVVANKVDLLPRTVPVVRLENWVRQRSRAGGAPHISAVHLVSAQMGFGIQQLADNLKAMAGPRGDVWVIGCQNAGKSSLINALGRVNSSETYKSALTEAAVPGTTIGILEIDGVLSGRARLYDTPGLLHPHQVTSRLTREEQKLLQPRKEMKPRTYRVKLGGAIHLGGLARIDVVSAPAESIYVTVWAAAALTCHMGKIETAEELFEKHVGQRLQPPIGTAERVAVMGRWMSHTLEVKGDRWDQSSKDIAFAGIGWVGIAMSGAAKLQIWTYEGLAVTVRDSMVLDMAAHFEKPGFSAEGKLPLKVAESGAKPREKRTSNNSGERDRRRGGNVKQSVVGGNGRGHTSKNSKVSISVRSTRDGKRRVNQ